LANATTALAYLAGTTTNAVQIRRANKGIPPFSDDKAISKPYDPLLGTMSDVALAKIFCVTAYEIGRRRRLLQVDIYEPRQGQNWRISIIFSQPQVTRRLHAAQAAPDKL
jgi:hypothetical protein